MLVFLLNLSRLLYCLLLLMLFTLPIDVYSPNLICLHCSIVNTVDRALKSGLPSLYAAGQDFFINIYVLTATVYRGI